MPREDPDVVKVLKSYRVLLDGREDALMRDMGRHWLDIEHKLEAEIALLAREIADRAASGRVITEQVIWRAERYQIIKAQLEDEVRKYNRDYAVGAISRAQEQYALLGLDAARDAINASYGPMGAYWNRINVGAVQSMIGFAGDGSPLEKLLRESYPDAVDGLIKALVNGIARGQNPSQTAVDMADGMGMGLDRSLLIARTETARAYRTASTEQYRQSGVVNGFRRLVKKETACMACLMLDGETFELAQELDDHPRGKAELPGNLIVSSTPKAFVTLYHQGDIVIIRTASGKFLPVTPNHPVLTDRGWVAAKFIKEGDNVLSHTVADGASRVVRPDEDHVPAVVEKIPSAFDMLRLGTVPETAKHLYSNGEDGEVDVVFANRFLWNSLNTIRQEDIKQYLFGSGHVTGFSLSAFRLIAENLVRMFFAPRELLGIGNVGFSLFGCHLCETQITGFGHAAPGNATFSQYAGDDVAGHTERFSDELLRLPGGITSRNLASRKGDLVLGSGGKFHALNLGTFGFTPEQPLRLEQIREGLSRSVPAGSGNLSTIARNVIFDGVTYVDVRSFSGHVYSLQTQEGWYSSNHIISHNCIAVPNVQGVKPAQWETGEQWFKTLSAEEQRERMGGSKYELWRDGQIQLSDLARKAHSDVWGDAPRIATLAELVN